MISTLKACLRQVMLPVMRNPIRLSDMASFSLIERSVRLSKLAYTDGLCTNTAAAQDTPVIFLDGRPQADTQVYVWADRERMFVAFRGTSSAADVLSDVDVRTVPLPELGGSVRVHKGFHTQFMAIKDLLWKHLHAQEEVVFCGHSLGGALATIAAAVFAGERSGTVVRCFTVGSPRVGNSKFAQAFRAHVADSVRVFNENDPVPMVPISYRFQHVDKGVCIDDTGQAFSVVADEPWFVRFYHHMQDLDPVALCDDHDCSLYIARVCRDT